MRVKFVVITDRSIKEELYKHVRDIIETSYVESLLFHEKGTYGLPELIGIRYPKEHEEKATVIHYGHNIQDLDETVIETGTKDELMYKYIDLGFKSLGEYSVERADFKWREFSGNLICINGDKCFLRIYRDFPGDDTEIFEEKQKRVWNFLASIGIAPDQLLSVDYWTPFVMEVLNPTPRQP